ncbi:MAG: LysR family transcriptional regulator [Hyphomicrobiaceae bacterium]|nr:LysR family transcriptional regulator [Hyphomicrobiaceae bacterium]
MRHLLPLRYIDAVVRAGSIRRAAEALAITSTALNRRILAIEDELGVPIFERLPRGVRLSTAGEILIQHVRTQLSDMERVRSQIADLSGVRRGHISIACSQAVMPVFLPEQIALYRREHPAVTFHVQRRDREAAEEALADHSADLALVFEPVRLAEFETLLAVEQPVHALMSRRHPLAANGTVRLRDCLRYPIAMPTHSYGVRAVLETAVLRSSIKLHPVIESDSFEFLRHYARQENAISFQIPIGISQGAGSSGDVSRPVDARDVKPGILYLGQLRGRALPVAVSRFASQIAAALAARFDEARAR